MHHLITDNKTCLLFECQVSSIILPFCLNADTFLFVCFIQISSSLLVTNVIMADNNIAILPLIVGPPALSHQTSDKFVRIENSLIVAVSPQYDCGGDDDVSLHKSLFSNLFSPICYLCDIGLLPML